MLPQKKGKRQQHEKKRQRKEKCVCIFWIFLLGSGCSVWDWSRQAGPAKGNCEIDKYANMSYQAMHHIKEGEWFEEDITKVSAQSLPDVDLWTGGFPCQDVSMAGERRGLYGERTGLFFEFVRLLRERGYHKPRWLILENVKGIFSSGGGWDFAIVLCELAALGYGVEYALVNSKDYGVPQSRERVYIIGDLQEEVPEKYFLSEVQARQLLHRLLEAHREAGSMTQEVFHQLSLLEQED